MRGGWDLTARIPIGIRYSWGHRDTDSNPLPPGGIWLEVLPDSEVLFDDVHICEPSD